jgi:DNA-binding winged helix-turn-helix (wHTH) protein
MVPKSFRFDAFTLDLERLCVDGPSGEARLRRKSFEVLRYLVEHAGRVATRQDLIDAVWSDVTVTDQSLRQCINEVRRALGDKDQRIIKTVPQRGYLFDLPVSAGVGARSSRIPAVDPPKG